MTVDPDGNVVNNLGEHGLSGDPAVGNDPGQHPVGMTDAGSWFYYIYPQRQGADDITYTVESADDLVAANRSNMFYEVTGTRVCNQVTGLDAVTNRIPLDMEDVRFLQLRMDAL